MILRWKETGLVLSLALLVCGAGEGFAASSQGATMPADVRAFVTRRESCDHARGEEPYDKARARQLEQQVKRFCKGADAELIRLKRIHAQQPAVMAVLGHYEADAE